MKKKQGILIVDDDADYREHLVNELSADYETVVGAETGEAAIAILAEKTSGFQFAVVDHQLGDGLDGIETTRQLVTVAPQIYPVVFSNVHVDTSPGVTECKYRALEAGAYRYLEWKAEQEDRKKDIRDFVSEIEHLTTLSDWISRFFQARAAAPSLLTQLNIGMDIIDRHFKVWFMNERMREIIGLFGPDLPKEPCSHWHGYTYSPCFGCLVQESLYDGTSHERIFLSPLPSRDKARVFFLRVWAQPVTNETGEIATAPDGGPLAVMESVQDLTDSPELKAMRLSERLQIIARAPLGITARDYTVAQLFLYCRVYLVDHSGGDEKLVLKAAAGRWVPPALDIVVNVRGLDPANLAKAEKNAKETGYGYGFKEPRGHDLVLPGQDRIPYIYCPVIENNRTVALIEVGCPDIQPKTAALLRPYAREVLRAIQDDRAKLPEAVVLAAAQVSDVEQSLQTKTSPEEQLRTIVSRTCDLTDSSQYIMRYVDGANAKLIRLRIPSLCAYESVAADEYPLSYKESWSCRAISAKAETLVDTVSKGQVIDEYRMKLSEGARGVLKDVNGLCYEPLVLDGVCIGLLGFHSRNADNYRDRRKLAVIRDLAKRATMALHDYVVKQRSVEKSEAILDVLGLVLHNLKTPLAAAGIALTRFLSRLDRRALSVEMQDLISVVKNQLDQIGRVRDDVLRLQKPSESRVETIDLPAFIRAVTDGLMAASEAAIATEYSFAPQLKTVSTDAAGMRICLEVLLQNAMDALQGVHVKDKRVDVTLRSASEAENGMIESDLYGLAVDVVDNGSGVSPAIASSLFKRRASQKSKGLGMGLVNCRAYALSAQGTVYYDSEHKPGTKFTLVLPYREEAEV